MDIKDFLQTYVKSTALRLGGEENISEVSGGGLEGFESSLEEINGWSGDSLIFSQVEGDRVILRANDARPLNLYGGTLNLGYLPVSGGSNTGSNITNIFGGSQIVLISTGDIDISSQSNNGSLTLRAGSTASSRGILIQSNAAGVGELKILMSDINGDAGLPTGTASLVANQLWNDGGTIKIYTP